MREDNESDEEKDDGTSHNAASKQQVAGSARQGSARQATETRYNITPADNRTKQTSRVDTHRMLGECARVELAPAAVALVQLKLSLWQLLIHSAAATSAKASTESTAETAAGAAAETATSSASHGRFVIVRHVTA